VAALDRGFWSGQRVLLTGHTGFKGAWAAIWLKALGAEVTGLALAPDQTPALFDLAEVGGLVTSRIVDLRAASAVEAELADRAFDLVLHMAAQPIVRTAIADPVATFAANVMGTANLLQALRAQTTLRAVLAVTSDKVYANAETGRASSRPMLWAARIPIPPRRPLRRWWWRASPAATSTPWACRWPRRAGAM
jgi:CDP-glucose 4,6-dehydratase